MLFVLELLAGISVSSVLPIVHYALMRQKEPVNLAQQILITAIPHVIASVLFPFPHAQVDLFIKLEMLVFSILRILELRVLSRSILVSNWSFAEYIEFYVTADNRPLRKQKKAQDRHDAWKMAGIAKVHPQDRTLAYYMKLLARQCVVFVIYCTCVAYFRKYPFTAHVGILSVSDFNGLRNYIVSGVAGLCIMDLVHTPIASLVFAIFDAPFIPLFNAPHRSTSLREFWGRRWNIPVKSYLHHMVFSPTIKFLESRFLPGTVKDKHKSSSGRRFIHHVFTAIGCIASFTVSGIAHEYFVWLFFLGTQPLGDNFCFFFVHGLLCVVEFGIQEVTGFGKLWGVQGLWPWVRWAVTMYVILLTDPLMAGPYLRGVGAANLPAPEFLVKFLDALI
ncbi:hypothetical protein BDR26DRAFT_859659 [Obelidium mucronatum]|nr:hypothetical protein BDR26DRAFT_859659 [Obelidium mucronatum]